MHCVVGSGPAGIACAQALLEKGLTVTMLDAGIVLEESRARVVEELAKSEPRDWDPKLVASLKENMAASARGLPQKLSYGSDFPYREVEQFTPCTFDGVGLRPSLAQGGLSNVWGAAMLPHLDSDLADWPIKTAQLAPHYEAVLRFTGLSARNDELAALFPLYTPKPGKLDLSNQAGTLLERMSRNKAKLERAGFRFGAARVAIKAKQSPSDPGCVYCGLCMYGCPYGYIYNSAATLHELQKNGRFTYQPDSVVMSFAESEDEVAVHLRNRVSGAGTELKAERLYLAAGAIATTRLLLASRQAYDQTLWLADSQYFLIPMLLFRRSPGVRAEPLHTLSQLFVELMDREISEHTVHLQVYSHSELIADALRGSLERMGLNFDFLARQLEQRLVVVQGFLHSNESSKISATLRRAELPEKASLELKAEINPHSREVVRKVVGRLMRHARHLGALPMPPMVEIAEPGRSFHTGGSFPMRQNPGPFESDILGRPAGWRRVHAVDATVLPSVPATTVTFAVMANAHRIGTAAAALS